MRQTNILIVDDHIVVRSGIRKFLSTESSLSIIGEGKNGQDAVYLARKLQPDVILMDLIVSENSLRAIAEIKQLFPNIKIIILSTYENEIKIREAMAAGIDGYLLKNITPEALVNAIQSVQHGQISIDPKIAGYLLKDIKRYKKNMNKIDLLTEREKEVLALVVKGLSNKAIGQTLGLTEGTIKIHVSNILGKLEVSNRIEAAIWAVRTGEDFIRPD